jgi:hypothetical protein
LNDPASPSALDSLLRVMQHGESLCLHPAGGVVTGGRPCQAVLPGAFNPLHEGHLRLAEVAASIVGAPVDFELSVLNVDKPPLSAEELLRRVGQFTNRAYLWITRAPTFAEKAELFPETTFVIGADTAERLVSPRYYKGEAQRLTEAFLRIRALGCRFLVAGRENAEGLFVGVENLGLPDAVRDLFAGIPKSALHVPLSSSALRGQSGRA